MPLRKEPAPNNQLWKSAERRAKREGTLKTVYETNGDRYTGEWHLDLKDGKGTCITKSGTMYDGDWVVGKRDGYGIRSALRDGVLAKEYSGAWVNDKKEGYGAQFYSTGERYEGEWFEGKRSGWGRMSYTDGSVYDGQWYAGQRSGRGLLLLANGNRYEGEWANNTKHGDGKFFFLNKGQLYTATWVDDVAKCGIFTDLERQNAVDPTQYPIPNLEMAEEGPSSIASLLAEAKEAHMQRFELTQEA